MAKVVSVREVSNSAVRRSKAVEAVNVALANVEAAKERLAATVVAQRKLLNDARSQVGTAAAEADKASRTYEQALKRLLSLLPEASNAPHLEDLLPELPE